MKTLTTVLTTIGILLWWEIPHFCILFALTNIAIALYKREWTLYYKVMIGMSCLITMLCIMNWDLDIGMNIVERMDMIRRARYTVQ